MKIKEKWSEYMDFVAKSDNKKGKFYALTPLLITLVIVFFVLIFLFSNWESKVFWFRNVTNPNKIYVEMIGLGLNDKLTIKWTCDTFCDTIIIYENEKTKYLNFKNSGNNIFLVYVNDSLILEKTQYKNTFWKGYKYSFKLEKLNGDYFTELDIE